MRAAGTRAAVFGLLAALVAGCAAGGALTSAPEDYAAYRQTRISPTLETRLVAADRYLDHFPSGTFVAPVSAYMERTEPVFYASKRGSAAGLQAYLRLLPTGPHSADAMRRLSAIRARRADDEAFGRLASTTEERLARVAAQRAAAREGLEAWVRRFLDPVAWKGPIRDAPPDVIVPWSLGLPVPVCAPIDVDDAGRSPDAPKVAGGRRCTKVVELGYAIPVEGSAQAREITLELVLLEDGAGRPAQVTLGGPEMFSRLQEAYAVRAVRSEDGAARMEAISRVVELVHGAFRRKIPVDAGCKRDVVAPVVLDLGCGGLRVIVRAGGGAEDDTIVITRLGG